MKRSLFAAAAILALAAGASYAEAAEPSNFAHYSHDYGQAVLSGRNQAVTTGRVGTNMHSVILSNGSSGLMMDNGNGTSTLIGPGSITTGPTPN